MSQTYSIPVTIMLHGPSPTIRVTPITTIDSIFTSPTTLCLLTYVIDRDVKIKWACDIDNLLISRSDVVVKIGAAFYNRFSFRLLIFLFSEFFSGV